MSHITRGRGKPVTLQQNRAQSPSTVVQGSGLVTKIGFSLGFSSSSGFSGRLESMRKKAISLQQYYSLLLSQIKNRENVIEIYPLP